MNLKILNKKFLTKGGPMNEPLFYHWIQKSSGIKDATNTARVKSFFEKVPGIDDVLVRAVREGIKFADMEPLIREAMAAKSQASPVPANASPHSSVRTVLPASGGSPQAADSSQAKQTSVPPASPSVAPKPKVKKPSFLQAAGGLLKAAIAKKKAAKASASAAVGAQPSGQKTPVNKKKLIWIGVGAVGLIFVILLIVSGFGGGSAYTSTVPGATAVTSPDAPPVLNAIPIDLRSSDWFKPIQILILIEVVGMLFALGMDAKIRKQWFDAVIPFAAASLVIFVGGGAFFGSWGVLILALAVVTLVFFNGGRDFSPIGTFFILVGAAGGLIFGKILAIQAAFGIQAAPVLPIGQMMTLFQLKAWSQLYFPLVVYVVLILGLVFSVLEAVRPSGDKNPRWGTVVGGVAGILTFYLLFHLVVAIPAWACYLVGFGLAIGISAGSQNERVMRLVTDKWGIRTMFDSAMLMTSVLLVVQLCTGLPGLFVR